MVPFLQLITLLLSCWRVSGQLRDNLQVHLGYATYQGAINPKTQTIEFLGIRYAASPTGPLRWRLPEAPNHEDGVLLATSQPNRCYQANPGTNSRNPIHGAASKPSRGEAASPQQILRPREDLSVPPMSEDCLFLNVYSPGPTLSEEPLPVVVWIHGGGFILGSMSQMLEGVAGAYDGNDLIRQSGGKVVVVIIQYRLGLFGFLSSRHIRDHGTLNAGIHDQDFALKWVQTHITKFGGDPSKVTLWGQSAGANSVLQHLTANGGKKGQPSLFRGAILSSSFLPSQYPYDHKVPEAQFKQALQLTGCSDLDCLRNAEVEVIQAANLNICNNAFFGTFGFAPVIDGSFIVESPTQALRNGRISTNHLMAVLNSHEGDMFVDPSISTSIEEYIGSLFPFLPQSKLRLATSLYNGRGSSFEQASEVMGDAIFVCPTYTLLRLLEGSVYKGEFAIPPSRHIEDVFYYFSSITTGGPPFPNTEFVDTFSQAFLDFVIAQNPNIKHDKSSILPQWPLWKSSAPLEVVFNRTEDLPNIEIRKSSGGLMEVCKFWESVASSTFQ